MGKLDLRQIQVLASSVALDLRRRVCKWVRRTCCLLFLIAILWRRVNQLCKLYAVLGDAGINGYAGVASVA